MSLQGALLVWQSYEIFLDCFVDSTNFLAITKQHKNEKQ